MKTKLLSQRLAGLIGAVVVFLLGYGILLFPASRLNKTLVRASYDWSFDLPFLKGQALENSEVVLIYLDEASHKALGQPFNAPWDRSLHARLVNRLKTEGARAIIFDIVFSDPGPNQAPTRPLPRRCGTMAGSSSPPTIRRASTPPV